MPLNWNFMNIDINDIIQFYQFNELNENINILRNKYNLQNNILNYNKDIKIEIEHIEDLNIKFNEMNNLIPKDSCIAHYINNKVTHYETNQITHYNNNRITHYTTYNSTRNTTLCSSHYITNNANHLNTVQSSHYTTNYSNYLSAVKSSLNSSVYRKH